DWLLGRQRVAAISKATSMAHPALVHRNGEVEAKLRRPAWRAPLMRSSLVHGTGKRPLANCWGTVQCRYREGRSGCNVAVNGSPGTASLDLTVARLPGSTKRVGPCRIAQPPHLCGNAPGGSERAEKEARRIEHERLNRCYCAIEALKYATHAMR